MDSHVRESLIEIPVRKLGIAGKLDKGKGSMMLRYVMTLLGFR